jgi:hypothetical protein
VQRVSACKVGQQNLLAERIILDYADGQPKCTAAVTTPCYRDRSNRRLRTGCRLAPRVNIVIPKRSLLERPRQELTTTD